MVFGKIGRHRSTVSKYALRARDLISDSLPESPLLKAFISGTAVIVFIRVFDRLWIPSEYSALAAVASSGVAVFVIAGLWRHYHQAASTDPEGSKDLRSAGDDLYYLGLLFTLVSLIIALVVLFVLPPGGDDAGNSLKQRTYQLIGNFGIALVSTVTGILGRILLQNVGEEDGNRSGTVLDSVMELRRELRNATDAFSHFTRVTQSHAEQVKIHSERLIGDFNDRMSDAAERGISSVIEDWKSSVRAISSDSRRLARKIDAEVSAVTDRNEAALRGLARDMVTVSESARRRLASHADEMETMLERMTSANRALGALVSGLEAAAESTRSLGETAAGSAIGLQERADEIVRAYDTLARGAVRSPGAGPKEDRNAVGTVTERAEAGSKQVTDEAAAARRLGERASRRADEAFAVAERVMSALQKRPPVGVAPTAPPGRDAPIEGLVKWSRHVGRKLRQKIPKG